MTREEVQVMVRALRVMQGIVYLPDVQPEVPEWFEHERGLCGNVVSAVRHKYGLDSTRARHLWDALSDAFEAMGLNGTYPVQHPTRAPDAAYNLTHNLWSGSTYCDNRRKLCGELIVYLEGLL